MFKYLTKKRRKNLRFITLFVTNRCQLRCRHCFNYEAGNQVEQELNCNEYEKIARSVGEFEILLISGGEPYLRPDLFEIVDIFKKISRVNFISIASNGFDSRKIIDRTREYLERDKIPLSVNLSIDGMKDTHNFIRGSPHSFDNCLATLEGFWKLRKVYPHFYPGINIVLMDVNSHEIEKLFNYFEDNYNGINIDVELLRPARREKELFLPDEKVIHKIQKKVLDNKKKNMDGRGFKKRASDFIELSQKNYIFGIQRKVIRGEKLPMRCLAGQTNAVIGANGEISFCEPLPAIGNLRGYNYNFFDIWNSKKARELRDKIMVDKCSCTHCVNIGSSIEYTLCFSLLKAPLYYLREVCLGN